MPLLSTDMKRILHLLSTVPIGSISMVHKSWWILCAIKQFQGGFLVALVVELGGRNRAGRCALEGEIVPSVHSIRM